jgi:hypothetical protein
MIIAWSVAGALSFPVVQAAPELGTVISHNGTSDSNPPGTGSIDVVFNYGSPIPLSVSYRELTTLQVEIEYGAGADPLLSGNSEILNNTGTPFTGFRIELFGADFAGHDWRSATQAPAVDPVVDLGVPPDWDPLDPDEIGLYPWYVTPPTLSSSSITRSNEQGSGFTDASLTVLFDNPAVGGLKLLYNVIPSPGAAGATGFTMHMTPIPEPASLCLLGLGALIAGRRWG